MCAAICVLFLWVSRVTLFAEDEAFEQGGDHVSLNCR